MGRKKEERRQKERGDEHSLEVVLYLVKPSHEVFEIEKLTHCGNTTVKTEGNGIGDIKPFGNPNAVP
jgi:hypothetical protein